MQLRRWGVVLGLIVAACGKSGGGGPGDGGPGDVPGGDGGPVVREGVLVYGTVKGATGLAISGAQIVAGATTVTANDTGYFTVTSLMPGTSATLQITAMGHAPSTKVVALPASGSVFLDVRLLPFDAMMTFDVAAGGTVMTGDGASVTFPPGAFTATGMVTVYVASLNSGIEGELSSFPGDFSTDAGEMLQSFGAISVEVRDAAGNDINLAPGQMIAASVPVIAGAPDMIDQWSFNEATGQWHEEGGGWTGCADGTCEGMLPHLSWWNCDMVLETTCVNVCLTDADGEPGIGYQVVAEGVTYDGRSYGYTGSDGCACLDVRKASAINVTATTSEGPVGPIAFTTLDAIAQCGRATCQDLPMNLDVVRAKFQAILTWQEQPGDLDSHFTGPCASDDTACAADPSGRFHISYRNRGNLASPPYAYLDTDDTTSFGPEITTLTQCAAGTYRYSVHNYSGSPAIGTSMAHAIVFLPDGSVVDQQVPSGGTDRVWIVGDLVCDEQERCTWQPANTFGPADETSYDP